MSSVPNNVPVAGNLSAPEMIIAGKYRLGLKIGAGGFGTIFYATTLMENEAVAVKMENVRAKPALLHHESQIYEILKGNANGIPELKWFGTVDSYNVLVLQLLGPSLEYLFSACHRKFTLTTVLKLADQMLERIEYVHSKGLIHRDLKPDNFLMGLGNEMSKVFIVDFGLSKKYMDSESKLHIPPKNGKHLTGTTRYASIKNHLGFEQSRRDDMEALGYILMYFLRGRLPWQGIKVKDRKKKYQQITEVKMATNIEDLCKECPPEFSYYIKYCRNLGFKDTPDYNFLRKMFQNLYKKLNMATEFKFDWRKPEFLEEKRAEKK